MRANEASFKEKRNLNIRSGLGTYIRSLDGASNFSPAAPPSHNAEPGLDGMARHVLASVSRRKEPKGSNLARYNDT